MTPRARVDQLPTAALALATVVFAWSLVDALRIGAADVEAAPRAADAPAPAGLVARASEGNSTAASQRRIAAAITRNPFSATRRAPRVPYRLAPAEAPSSTLAGDAPPAELPLVLGTAIGANGASFAMCTYAGEPAIVVRVGDPIGPFTVVAIARGRVTVRDAEGTRLELVAPDASDGVQP